MGPNPDSVAIGLGAVWVTLTGGAEIVGIDPRTRTRQESQDVKTRPESIAVAEGKIWIANSGDATVGVVEPNVGGFATSVGSEPTGVALGGGKLWVTDPSRDAVWRLHAVTGRRTGAKITVGSKPLGVAIWVTNRNDGTLTRIDPNSGKVRGDPIKVGSEPVGVAVGRGRVWVANFGVGHGHACRAVTRYRKVTDDVAHLPRPKTQAAQGRGTGTVLRTAPTR